MSLKVVSSRTKSCAELHGEAELVDHAAANGDILQVRLGQSEVLAQALRVDGLWQLLVSGLQHAAQPSCPTRGDRLEPGAPRVERVKHCIVHLLSERLNGGFRLDVVSTRITSHNPHSGRLSSTHFYA